MNPIRVLIIDDSAFMRKMITEILTSDKRIKVIDTARNGEDGLRKIKKLLPDVITLDIEMPIMDGIKTLKQIMQTRPLPVVMLSSVTDQEASKTMKAISNGAVDFIMKPSGPISLNLEDIKQEIITKVLSAASVNGTIGTTKNENLFYKMTLQTHKYDRTIITIETSTRGPRALQRVLSDLPKISLPPILIVQHMPQQFIKSLAERLKRVTHIHVKEATQGELIKNNTAYIAPGNKHMKVRTAGLALAIELTDEEPRNGHRPSVDTLFESIANIEKVNKVAIVLTGMGSDGARGLKVLKSKDPSTMIFAESEESAVIYGMPRAALHTGVVHSVIHLNQIGELIGDLTKKSGEI